MSTFPEGIQTRDEAKRLLRHIDGREDLELGEWDIDDFISVRRSDPVVEQCRIRVRDELIDLLGSRDARERERIPAVVDDILNELTNAAD